MDSVNLEPLDFPQDCLLLLVGTDWKVNPLVNCNTCKLFGNWASKRQTWKDFQSWKDSGNFFYCKSTIGTTIAAIEANNDTYCLQKQIEKFVLYWLTNEGISDPGFASTLEPL